MRGDDTVLTAVLSTLLQATADRRAAVVLRSRRSEQARELARWLARAHGSPRTVIASTAVRGEIEVRLPARVPWADVRIAWAKDEKMIAAMAAVATAEQLSSMTDRFPAAGAR
jgi:hypothetical protein